MPDGASDVVGSVSTTVRVEGDAFAANAPSPLRGADVDAWLNSDMTCAAGYAGLTVPVFAGRVADLDTSEESGRLVLSGRDAADKITKPVRLRAFGGWSRSYTPGTIENHPTNSAAVITSILHANGIRVTPAPRDGRCELSVPGVGGWLADIGWTVPVGASVPAGPWLAEGRFSVAPTSTERVRGYFTTRRDLTGASVLLEAFVNVTAGMSSEVLRLALDSGSVYVINIDSGNVYLSTIPNPGTPAVRASAAITAGWRHVAVEITPAVASAKVWIDGVVKAFTSWSSSAAPAGPIDRVEWYSGGIQGIAVYWGTSPAAAPSPEFASFAAEADIPAGALDYVSIPDVDGAASWDVLKAVASAELGMVGYSETGRFYFKPRASLSASSAPVATWGVDLVDDLHPAISIDSVITRVTANVSRQVGVWSDRGSESRDPKPSLVADTKIAAPPGTSSVIVSGSSPVLADTQRVVVLSAWGAAISVPAGIVFCFDENGASRYAGSSVTAWITPVGMGSYRLTIQNASGSTLYAVWPEEWTESNGVISVPFELKAGDPSFYVLGYAFPKDDTTTIGIDRVGAAAATWGERVWQMEDSVWRQDPVALQSFIDGLLVDTARPRVTIADVEVPADPRWQLGDPIRLTDWRGRVPGIVARITSVALTLSRNVENGMTGRYGLRQVVGVAPRVTSHPADATRSEGNTATFTVTATSATGYQWQSNDGRGWSNIAGATGSSYTTPALTLADTGKAYRCNVVGAAGDDWSRSAKLTVTVSAGVAPAITAQPSSSSASGYPGDPYSVTAAASGSPTPGVQWQRSADGTTGWVNIAGATSVPLTQAHYPGSYGETVWFRAVFTNSAGSATTTALTHAFNDVG
ncbi:immunoglobulin domain-containing protein [Microbacterium ginsengisoli]|uniref:immunoglobulin domain-containing protein n=2 Tax=Microbacterium TaxID=33882 RepID=UPI002FDDB419